MRSGQLDQKITLQSLTETNQSGELVQSWVTVANVWAYIIAQQGAEAFEAARTNARKTIRVKVRYRGDLNATWRMVWENDAYNITYVDPTMKRKGELWFTAELVGA